MRTQISMLVLVLVAGCKNQSSTPAAGSGSAAPAVAAGSGSTTAPATGSAAADSAAAGSAAAGSAAAGSAAGCDLTGDYRVRYRSNGDEGYWLRFTVAGTPPAATLAKPAKMLEIDAGPIDTAADATACTLALTAHNAHVGDLKIALAVDPRTHAVKGELTRTKKVSKDDSPSPVAGMHDRAPVTLPADACLAPAVYALEIDRKHKWQNAEAGDKRSCKRAAADIQPIFLRVEWLGSELVIDTVDDGPPWNEKTFTAETVKRTAPCEVELEQSDSSSELTAKLTFADGALTGTASMKHQMVLERGESEDVWDCETTDLPVKARRVASF